jgi:hypothetical protein
MKPFSRKITLLVISIFFISSTGIFSQNTSRIISGISSRMKKWENPLTEWQHIGKVKLDSAKVGKDDRSVNLYFSTSLSYYPIREESAARFNESVKEALGRKYRKLNIDSYSNGHILSDLIPNIYRRNNRIDSSRFPVKREGRPPVVRNNSSPFPSGGLNGKSIALWHSHGYYYEMSLDRWEWQRARLFGIVEDISVMGYVLPYLTPMLENAGANVFLPRERDTQVNEVIVDNDKSTGNSEFILQASANPGQIASGFLITDTLYQGINPFRLGTSLQLINDSAIYVPDFPEEGDYSVSVSWPRNESNSPDVKYMVYHSGGKTEFSVNQAIGGSTWIYLGTFHFKKGKNDSLGSVRIKPGENGNGFIGLDAVRFGGGTGSVARRPSPEIIANRRSVSENTLPEKTLPLQSPSDFSWKISGKPRYLEGARYWLQYAGMPDTLVYSPNSNKNDYNDDYQSRGAWVNYLMAPQDSNTGGLGIPLDLSVGFHTDAGITENDSVIGTLAIYSTAADNGKFPDGSSRMASRDFSDIVQTQIVQDIRSQHYPEWTRRGLWDRPYSEAMRPNVPAMLLELLSHQNLADQRFGLDPRFRFTVSRAVYKGILKYLAYVENRDYVVQPLAVSHFAITPSGGKRVRLSWEPVADTLEPTANPDKYRVFTRTSMNGFDNGFIVDEPYADIELGSYDSIYSFKVTALNAGGESFPSEILSVGLKENDTAPVLVVNGFDRISGPEWFDDHKKMGGIAWWDDRGVADGYDISTVGDQYDFDRKSPWLDDDAPGWGASYADMEGKVIPGNTRDFTYVHGKAIMNAGHSFISVSDEYFCSEKFNLPGLEICDLLYGEEKSTVSITDTGKFDFRIYTPEFMKRISGLSESGVNIFISGAYIGSDLFPSGDSASIKFASGFLHFSHRTGHSVNNGGVYPTDYAKPDFTGKFSFNTGYLPQIYSVESPDAIEAAGKGAVTILRYSQNNTSAGVAYNGRPKTVAIGFPFETIIDNNERDLLMKQILGFFGKQRSDK